jgi:hypothetical protein
MLIRAMMALCVTLLVTVVASSEAQTRAVSSLGRIEPHNGVYKLAGPSEISVVATLRMQEGDLEHAKRVLARQRALKQNAFQSAAVLDEAERELKLREAELVAARARLALSSVRAPSAGQILAIHARESERIGIMIAPNDSLGFDPVARTDSRVVEVFILLNDPGAVASLTNLQVSVEIGD